MAENGSAQGCHQTVHPVNSGNEAGDISAPQDTM
jgi:hypothetical protein